MPDRKKKSEKAAAAGQDSTTEDAPAKDSNNSNADTNNNNANAGSEKEKENEPKTIDTIWKQAVEKIAKENNINVDKLQQAGTFKDADSGIAKATKLFENSRHPKDKKDKAMTAVGGCLDWIDSTAGFVKDNVSGTVRIISFWLLYFILEYADLC
jgi:pyruvate/2-oxoglutarate dehydrogenase complex dihydrolipoamide acyltransferase (E2) component